ncbi:CMRF35-like molecule 1 isoform X2 [Cyclopterus lumpus]|uniref:CMRF35-like molecule 1 isoform X2 n=1 Tax=Cyclopterus lumpus TaxID=8103 RepID=UPI0014864601|nr:CMRF35-like molecule 1 isoform X2 [Cyclopterus lumpus]
MIKIYAFSCLLSALSIVEVKLLIINGHVGQDVTIRCSGWKIWTNEKKYVKYFCDSPCTGDSHIIAKAAYGKTTYKNRIQLKNRGKGLFVTFTNLHKSDSKTYFCGLERTGADSFIKVFLHVIDAPIPSPKTTPKTVIVGSTMSSSSSDVTDMSSSYTTLNTTAPTEKQGSGSVPYLVAGVIAIIIILMVLLKLINKMMKHQMKVESSADVRQEDAQEDVQYDEIRPEDQTDPDVLYANYSHHQGTQFAAESRNSNSNDLYLLNLPSRSVVDSRGASTESKVTNDLLYSVAQLPKKKTEPTENEPLYSLAQTPQAT